MNESSLDKAFRCAKKIRAYDAELTRLDKELERRRQELMDRVFEGDDNYMFVFEEVLHVILDCAYSIETITIAMRRGLASTGPDEQALIRVLEHHGVGLSSLVDQMLEAGCGYTVAGTVPDAKQEAQVHPG